MMGTLQFNKQTNNTYQLHNGTNWDTLLFDTFNDTTKKYPPGQKPVFQTTKFNDTSKYVQYKPAVDYIYKSTRAFGDKIYNAVDTTEKEREEFIGELNRKIGTKDIFDYE